MPKTKLLYCLLFAVALVFVGYVLYQNVLHDPGAAEFLRHKQLSPRSFHLPVWLSVMRVHLAFACLAMLSGAVNFSAWLLRKHRKFHKRNGYAYLVSVLVVSLTSGYMAPYATGGEAVSFAFNMLSIIWPAFTVLAILSIRKKKIERHRRWMVRSYAFCFTNMAVHMLAYALHRGAGLSYPHGYGIAVYGAIALLLLAPEIVLRTFFREPTVQIAD